jgi:hypothetical protein
MKLYLQIDFHQQKDGEYEPFKEMDVHDTLPEDVRYVFEAWTHFNRVSDPNNINSHTGNKNFYIDTMDNFMNITYGEIEKKLYEIFGFTDEEIKQGVFIEDVTINNEGVMEAHVEVYVN